MRKDTLAITSDKVIRAMFIFALGVVFTVIQLASDDQHLLFLILGILWSVISFVYVIKAVKKDWNEE